jgi:threonyl-tRNA synthetase
MRVLQLHCSNFNYRTLKETPVAEHPAFPREGKFENILVCFTCFEKKDVDREEDIIEQYTVNIKIDTERIGCNTVMLHPYAHLSHELGSPKRAKKFLADLETSLKAEGIDAHKSPFGWYKAFGLYCKGHPLSEAYREY